jgi:hypothetical protein
MQNTRQHRLAASFERSRRDIHRPFPIQTRCRVARANFRWPTPPDSVEQARGVPSNPSAIIPSGHATAELALVILGAFSAALLAACTVLTGGVHRPHRRRAPSSPRRRRPETDRSLDRTPDATAVSRDAPLESGDGGAESALVDGPGIDACTASTDRSTDPGHCGARTSG